MKNMYVLKYKLGEEFYMVRNLKRLFIALLATCISLGSIDFNVFVNVIEEKEKLKEELDVEGTWDKKTTQSIF